MSSANELIESLLLSYKEVIGGQFNAYRNHVYRVYLNCLLIDPTEANAGKYAVAAVFHDIGIWIKHSFDYIDPSIEQAEYYLTEEGACDWVEEIAAMIYWHHKTAKYKGNYQLTVETFRKADWTDVSFGLFRFGLKPKQLKENRRNYPGRGFHLFLLKGVSGHAFRHPFYPLPMFK
ncbi:HD domain-containing protein [Filimonas effusa]|uniref:HD domain-containing protein n=1 Tax=Filimonas effusa TaxID=2508721 RepID=A0A4Q1D665_9BACT|nr:HD domain-containing protein [Filimonas effusa]RXK83908.1 hypothetical protein ESB13_17715 [Filimonas effusa]